MYTLETKRLTHTHSAGRTASPTDQQGTHAFGSRPLAANTISEFLINIQIASLTGRQVTVRVYGRTTPLWRTYMYAIQAI